MTISKTETVEVDGSHGEGGGQILRTSLALSALTGKRLEMTNIRARRSKPGLRPQHLQAVKAAAEVCQAKVEGDRVGSLAIRFTPQEVRGGDYRFDIGTAGSTSLVLQTVYLPLLLDASHGSSVTITGGTHVPYSPSFHYLDLQWRPFLARIGLHCYLQIGVAGYYPKGGGEIRAEFAPSLHVRPLVIEKRGELRRITGVSAVTNLPMSIAERQKSQAQTRLADAGCPVEIATVDLHGVGQGTMLLLLVEFENSHACYFGLGARGKPAERVADEAADEVRELLQGEGQMDYHLADQIILPLAIANGTSSFIIPAVTTHLLTNADVIRKFLPAEIDIDGEQGREGTITVRGAAW